MLDNLINKLLNDGSAELVYLIVGSLILYVSQYFFRKYKELRFHNKLRKELDKYQKRQTGINVIDLANGDPEFKKEHVFSREISIFGSYKCLYIDMPKDMKKVLRAYELEKGYSESQLTKFHMDTSFDGGETFRDLVELTGIDNLPELIDRHRRIVGESFLSAKEGMLFNGEKYGVHDLLFTRFGEDESPGVEIDFFHTDYFTHQIFRSIYRELKSEGHPISQVTQDNFLQYRPFFTSFGINALLICEGAKGGKEIILSRRSGRVSGAEEKYHITMNEGLSQTDKDPFGKVDLELCFKRGLLEELGINDKLYQFAVKGAFYDFFLERNNLEIGLSSVFELDLNYHRDIEPLIARDKNLETNGFVTVPLKANEIEEIISKETFIPHGLYVLERVLLRENIIIADITSGLKRYA